MRNEMLITTFMATFSKCSSAKNKPIHLVHL